MSIISDMWCLCLRLTCVAALLGIPLAGCSDTDGAAGAGGAGGTGGTAGTGGSGGSGGTPSICDQESPPPVTIFFSTLGGAYGAPGVPLPDVRICESGTDNCTMSSDEGKASLEFPACQEVAWTFEKEGYMAFAGADVTDETLDPGPFTWKLPPVESLEPWAEAMGTTYPWNGVLNRTISSDPTTGITYTAVGADAEVCYVDDGLPDCDLSETSGGLGDGIFVDLLSGELEVEFGGTATDCVASLAWPSERPNTIRIPVFEGFTTYGSMRCGEQ